MFKKARYLRWLTLLISLAIESVAFWIGGPKGAPNADFLSVLLLKLGSADSWIWVGWTSFTLAWLWPELAHYFYANGRRSQKLIDKTSGEELVYDTGLHWLVLFREIWTGEINDGNEKELNEPLFVKGVNRSFTWHAVWWPIRIAGIGALFFVGWIAWLVATFPETLTAWSKSAQEGANANLKDGLEFLAGPADWLISAVPAWLISFHGFARESTLAGC